MQTIEVLINNKQMDLSPDAVFPLILAQNVYYSNEIDARGGEFSYTVQFPYTTNNLNILNINTIVEQNGKFYTNLELNTIIYVNSIKIFQGIFTITKYNNQLIEGFFKSSNISWASLLSGKKLNEITSFAPYPFIGMETILNNMADQYLETDPSTYNHNKKYDVCFPLVAYGQYFIPYYAKSRSFIDTTNYAGLINAGRFVKYNAFQNLPFGPPSYILDRYDEQIPFVSAKLNHLDYQDIPPSYYVTNIIKAMFNDIGYSVSGSWINDPQVNRLIIPTSNVDDVYYNLQTLVDITATLLVDKEIRTQLWPLHTPQDKNTQRNTLYTLIPPNPPGNPVPQIASTYPDGMLQSMTTLGWEEDLYIEDIGFNTANPRIYGDFFCPEDGTYELSYNINGECGVYDSGFISPAIIPAPLFFQDIMIGFFYVTDPNEVPSIVETHETSYFFDLNFGAYDCVQLKPIPFVSAIPGESFGSTYSYAGFFAPQVTFPNLLLYRKQFNLTKTVRVDLKKGEILRFMVIGPEHNFANPYTAPMVINIDAGSTWGIKNVSSDVDFNVSKNLPAVTCTDFLSGLIKMFNLYFTVDPVSKVITFEKRDNFYLNPATAIDLNDYTDIHISDILPIEIPENYKFMYKPDNKDYLSNLSPDLYSYTVNTVVSNKETQTIQPIFSDTRMKKFNLVKNSGNQTTLPLTITSMNNPIFQVLKEIEIPMISDEDNNKSLQFDLLDAEGNLVESYKNWEYENNIRILKISDQPYDLNLTPLVLRFWNTFIGEAQFLQGKEIPRALFVEADNTLYSDYQLDSLDWESLYNKNWYNFILNQQRSNKYVVNVKMTFDLYNKLQSNRLVKIDGNYFYIESITGFNVMNQESVTTMTLNKKVN